MSVNELQALEQQFADAPDRRDLKPVLEMLSEDVEVFDHVPYRLDGKPLFAKHLNETVTGIVSASFGFRQPLCRVYGDTVGIVNAYDMFMRVTKRRQGPRPSKAELPWSSSNKASGGRLRTPTSLRCPWVSENQARACGRLEMGP
jgi:ketosteroid isomerase-like protein